MTKTADTYTVIGSGDPMFITRAEAEAHAAKVATADPNGTAWVAQIVTLITAKTTLSRESLDGKDPDNSTPPNFFGM